MRSLVMRLAQSTWIWRCEVPNCACATRVKALLDGVPVFMMSAQGEQFLMARSIEHLGLGTNAMARLRPLDHAALMRPSLRNVPIPDAAQVFATKYSCFSPAQQAVQLVDAFERLTRHHSHTGLPR